MWCELCSKPVAGVKTTHRARNTIAGLAALPTMGYSLIGSKAGDWHCPGCGQQVRTATRADIARLQRTQRIANVDPSGLRFYVRITGWPENGRVRLRDATRFGSAIEILTGQTGYSGSEGFWASLPGRFGPFDMVTANEVHAGMSACGFTSTVEDDGRKPEPAKSANPPSPVREESDVEKLSGLAELHKSGALTDEEFTNAKTRILGGG
jgi:hypothetical protein